MNTENTDGNRQNWLESMNYMWLSLPEPVYFSVNVFHA